MLIQWCRSTGIYVFRIITPFHRRKEYMDLNSIKKENTLMTRKSGSENNFPTLSMKHERGVKDPYLLSLPPSESFFRVSMKAT